MGRFGQAGVITTPVNNCFTKRLPIMTTVDCRGLKCPMPIIKTRLKLNSMRKDQELTIIADDITFEEEFKRFCFLADLELVEKQENEGFQTYHVKVLR